MHWFRWLMVFATGWLGGAAFGVAMVPIAMQPKQAYGQAVTDVRGDDLNLYLRINSLDLIAIQKSGLLNGVPSVQYLDPARWELEFAGSRTSTLQELSPPDEERSSNARLWQAGRTHVRTAWGYCGEGQDEHHGLWIDGKKVDTGMDSCMNLTDPVVFDGKLWFGSNRPGEYADGAGVGVLVFDVERKRRVAQVRKSLSQGQSGVMYVDEYLGGVWVVNRSAIHFFNRRFQLISQWFYSEQFDPTASRWSQVALSKYPRAHDAFAVVGRIIHTPDGWESGNSEELPRALKGARWISTNGIQTYQRLVSRLPAALRSEFWVHYDDFERQIFPMWRKWYMDFQHGGKDFTSAGNLIKCLHIQGEGGRSMRSEQLVQNIIKATQADVQDGLSLLAKPEACPTF